MDETTSTILHSDQKRVKQSAGARWRKLLEDQRASGLPVSAFCRERGIAASSLFAWRRKLTGVGQATFKPVMIVAQSKPRQRGDGDDGGAEATIELCLPRERRLMVRRGFDRQLLAELILALESLA